MRIYRLTLSSPLIIWVQPGVRLSVGILSPWTNDGFMWIISVDCDSWSCATSTTSGCSKYVTFVKVTVITDWPHTDPHAAARRYQISFNIASLYIISLLLTTATCNIIFFPPVSSNFLPFGVSHGDNTLELISSSLSLNLPTAIVVFGSHERRIQVNL